MKRESKYIITLLLCLMSCIGMEAQSTKWTQFPTSFKHTQKNVLKGGEYLDSALMKAVDSTSTIRIMHIGDSHVRGKAFPNAVEASLRTAFHNMYWAFYGINGAWASRFSEYDMIDKVKAENPDIVIISFGTNESHAPAYNEEQHTNELMTLICRLEAVCPNVKFILTTPPGSYLRSKAGRVKVRGRYRTNYSHARNERTGRVAKNIVDFAKTNHIACWDIYNIAGGDLYASTNWRDANLMNTDFIHYNVNGYSLMGKLLAEAIIQDYYVRIAH